MQTMRFQRREYLSDARSVGFFVDDSLFVGSQNIVNFEGLRRVYVTDTTIKGREDADTSIQGWTLDQVNITNTTAVDYDPGDSLNGWGIGRLFYNVGDDVGGTFGSSGNMYVARNRTQELGVSPDYTGPRNVGEQVLFEHNEPVNVGLAVRAENRRVAGVVRGTVVLPYSKPSGDQLFVLDGTGAGQYGRILSVAAVAGGYEYVLERAWSVIPGTTSSIVLTSLATRLAIVDNVLDGKAANINPVPQTQTAGVMLYGGVVDAVVERNRITDQNIGVMIHVVPRQIPGAASGQYMAGLMANNYVAANEIGRYFDSGTQSWVGSGVYQGLLLDSNGGVNYRVLQANVFRGNTIRGAVDAAIVLNQGTEKLYVSAVGNLFAGNSVQDSQVGIALSHLAYGWAHPNAQFYGNSFSRGSAALSQSAGLLCLYPYGMKTAYNNSPEIMLLNIGGVENIFEGYSKKVHLGGWPQ
jgi:hypothetical protein